MTEVTGFSAIMIKKQLFVSTPWQRETRGLTQLPKIDSLLDQIQHPSTPLPTLFDDPAGTLLEPDFGRHVADRTRDCPGSLSLKSLCRVASLLEGCRG